MVCPIVDNQPAVDPEPDPVVALRVDPVGLRELGPHAAGPSDAEGVGADTGCRSAGPPVEIDRLVHPRQGRAGEVRVVEVLPQESVAAIGRACDIARREGRVDRWGRNGMDLRATVRPALEQIACRPGSLGCDRFDRPLDSHHGIEGGGRAGWLAIDPDLQPGGIGGHREPDHAWKDIPEGRMRQAGRIPHGQVDPVPDIRGRLPGGRDQERSTRHPAGWLEEGMRVRTVVKDHLPGEGRGRQRAVLRVGACPGERDRVTAAVSRTDRGLRDRGDRCLVRAHGQDRLGARHAAVCVG